MTIPDLIALLERERFELRAAHAPLNLAYRQGWNQRAEALLRRLRPEAAPPAPPEETL
jgi:hypothetical protein